MEPTPSSTSAQSPSTSPATPNLETHSSREPKYPWVPHEISQKVIARLSWGIVLSLVASIIAFITSFKNVSREPWILRDTPNGFVETKLERYQTTREDIDRYLNMVIPILLGHAKGEAPGLDRLKGLVNENVIAKQKAEIESLRSELKTTNANQAVFVTGINQERMMIDPEKKEIYVEFNITSLLTKFNQTKTTESQCRATIYIVPPSASMSTSNSVGTIPGNYMGLYLFKLQNQPKGTINTDLPNLRPAPPIHTQSPRQTAETNP